MAQTVRNKQIAVTSDLNINTHKIINVANPTENQDVATKFYVDSVAQGISPHAPVRVVSTGQTTLQNTQTVDGIVLSEGNFILVAGQIDSTQNGIYIVHSGVTSWERRPDADGNPNNEVQLGDFVFVESGLTNTSSGWVLSDTDASSSTIYPDINSQVWYKMAAPGSYTTDGIGIQLNGNVFTISSEISTRTSYDNSLSTSISINTSTDTSVHQSLSSEISIESSTRISVDNTKAATNQTMYIGTTSVTINRSSGSLSLAGVNIDGTAGNSTNLNGQASSYYQPASTAITTGNIGSQSVNYATTAGSAPASDVYTWAKAASKPSYTKSEVGLSSVDNTADANKSVNYATTAGSAPANGGTSAACSGNATSSSKTRQLEAFTGSDFTGGDHYLRAIRETGWTTRLYMGYFGDTTLQNSIKVSYADSAGSAANVTGGALSGNLTASNYGIGNVGIYLNDKYQAVFSMGASFLPSADGTSIASLYGISWTHTNVGGQSKAGLSHQALFVTAGATQTAIGTGIWTIGAINANGDIIGNNSDKRLKTNIEPILNALDKVDKLLGFTYTSNELAHKLAGYDMDERKVGVFAQDIQAVLPEAVKPAPFDIGPTSESVSGDNYLTVQYEKIVPLLIEAIKELRQEINELKNNK